MAELIWCPVADRFVHPLVAFLNRGRTVTICPPRWAWGVRFHAPR